MDSAITERLRPLAAAIAFAGALLVFLTAIDFVLTVWPLRFGTVGWRYGSAGLLGGFLLTPLLGVAMLMAVAALCEYRGMQGLMMVLSLVMAILLALVLVGFALDALQVRVGVADDQRRTFDIGVIKAAFKHLTGTVAFGWLALGARQSLVQMGRSSDASRRGEKSSKLVVGEKQ